MKKIILIVTIVVASVLTSFVSDAQSAGAYLEDTTIAVFVGNAQRINAWCGGFNNPEISTGDINGDGKKDIVIYEPWGVNKTRVLLNIGTNSTPVYRYSPYHDVPFNNLKPDTSYNHFSYTIDYLKLMDYNRDGVPDLLVRGETGMSVFKGYRANNRVEFTHYKNLYYKASNIYGISPAYNQPTDIPAVGDIDGDGDIDFLTYNEGGAIMYFYKNCQVEHNLPKDTIEVCKPTNCWGYTSQGLIREVNMGIVKDDTFCPPYDNYNCKGCLHAGNTICMVDIDRDGDKDILNGNVSFPDIQLQINGRVNYGAVEDTIVAQDTLWKGIHLPTWPAAFAVDVTGDNLDDIIVAPHAYEASENYKTMWLFKNIGTATSPIFQYQKDTFLVDETLDFGTNSYPVLYDYDRDGKLDLFVGSGGYFQPDGTLRSKIAYYKNVKTGNSTRFELQTDNYMDIFSENVEGAYPTFGDLDNDGVDDMVVGHSNGTIYFYKNMATSNSATPSFIAGTIISDNSGTQIKPTNYASPFIYDIDRDGKPDLLITGERSSVFYYKNVSTASGVYDLKFITDTLGGMKAGKSVVSKGTIFIGKIDSTGKPYILLGNRYGGIRRYTGFENGNTTTAYQLLDTNYSYLDMRKNCSVTVGDVDGDGMYNMFTGNELGGLQQFAQVKNVGIDNNGFFTHSTRGECRIFPNPATTHLNIIWDNAFAQKEDVTIRITSITGMVVETFTKHADLHGAMISIASLPEGIYTCMITTSSNHFAQNILVNK